MFKVVLVDDDPLSLETLKDSLLIHFKEYEIVDTFSGVQEAIQKLPLIHVDLVFLDMQLKDGEGFDVLKALGEIKFEVIVITMYDTFMLEAIKYAAIDYLLKPVRRDDLASSIERFEKRTLKKVTHQNAISDENKKPNRLVISNQNGLILLDIQKVLRLESDGAYTKIYSIDRTHYFTSKNLGHYEQLLANYNFFRVHHSHIINLNQVINFTSGSKNVAVLSDLSEIEVSRRKKGDFLKKLDPIKKLQMSS
jgi:two-component system LytT family response regulator